MVQYVAVIDPFVVAKVMKQHAVWWAIAGGWAIDLWLGATTREHHDVRGAHPSAIRVPHGVSQ